MSTPARGLTTEQEATLASWLPRLRAKEMMVAHAAKALGCSNSLASRVRDNLAGAACRGRRTVLSAAQEEAIKTFMLRRCARGAPLRERDFCACVQVYINSDVSAVRKCAVQSVFKDGKPARAWMRGAFKRHPAVAKVAVSSLEEVRAAATNPENMPTMLALIKQVREQKSIHKSNVFNCDECGVSVKGLLGCKRQTRFLAAAGSKGTKVVLPGVSADEQFLTVMPIISADGGRLPLTFVVKRHEGHPKKRRPLGVIGGAD